MNTNDFLRETREYRDGFQKVRPRIYCKNGVSLSVQAGKYLYSTPRNDYARFYLDVEVGFPSIRPPREWEQYFNGSKWQDDSVIGWIKRVWENRSSVWYAIKKFDTRYLKRLLTFQDNACDSVYGYIPVELVDTFIENNGGIDLQKTLKKSE